jgi:hypothetical protein
MERIFSKVAREGFQAAAAEYLGIYNCFLPATASCYVARNGKTSTE